MSNYKQEYYPNYNDINFDKVLDKYEFSEKDKRKIVYQDPRQLVLKNLISKNTIYDNMLLFWQTGTGKCMKKNTPILMFDGTIKKIQDIVIGELIMGDDCKPRDVLSLSTGVDKMYDIISDYGNKYTVNQEHILCLIMSYKPNITINNEFTVNWVDIKDISKYTKVFKSKGNAHNFLDIKIDEYSKCENIIEISVKNYIELPEETKSILRGYKIPIEFSEKHIEIDPYIIGIWLGGKINSNLNLNSLYFDNKYKIEFDRMNSYEEIPYIYKCNSRLNRLRLLAGLIDTNGVLSIDIQGYKFNLQFDRCSQVIDDITYVCQSLGLSCYKVNKKLCIHGNGIRDIPIFNKLLKETSLESTKNILISKITVEYLNKDNYYGFTLSGNGRYVLGDFTVTHNTATAITIAEGFKEYVANMGRKILVLVKNGNIESNFRNELLSKATERDPYINEFNIDNINKINRKINKIYNFMTYGSFVNKVLGLKQYEKDNLGRNTSRQVKINNIGLRKSPSDSIINLNNTVIIIDEAHNITNNDVYIALTKVLENSYNYRMVLLTATPMYDNPKEIFEISNLLNMNNPNYISPIRNKLFQEYLIERGDNNSNLKDSILKSGLITVTDKGKKILSNTLLGKVSFLQANKDTFPEKRDMGQALLVDSKGIPIVGTINVVPCYMSEYQYKIYINALKLDSNENSTISLENLDNDDSEDNIEEETTFIKSSSLYKNSSDASTMTYPNNNFGKDGYNLIFKEKKKNGSMSYELLEDYKDVLTIDLLKYSSKLYNLLNNIKHSKGNVFIYSNYVNQGGTSLIKELLLANGYYEFNSNQRNNGKSFVLYDDTSNAETREYLRKIFNSKENKDGINIKIIIGSPVISEGITLKNVNQVHILEPCWNMSRINQIIGRAIRHHSHDDIPERKYVEIYKYCSIYKRDSKHKFIDKEKYILSEEKDRSNKDIERLLKTISFDCNINNKFTPGKDYTAECDYSKCSYECLIKPNSMNFKDKYTYNLYIEFFDQFDIEINTHLIKNMFKNYFIWTQEDIINNLKTIEPVISNESIFAALKQLIDNKTLISDKYDRSGYLINKGNYFIFNCIDIDVNTSIFSKMLDFSKNINEYTLTDYVESKLNKSIKVEPTNVKINKGIKQINLSKKDIEYNQNIIDNNKIYGSYRSKPVGESIFGPIDDNFRITDTSKLDKDNDDKRKNISGTAAKSYKKNKLIDIIRNLDINIKKYKAIGDLKVDTLSITQLIDIIRKYMKEENLILK